MNSHFLAVPGEGCSVLSCSVILPSATSNGTTTASESLPPESVTESCPMPLFSAISKHSSVKGTPQAIRDWLMSSVGDSPVSPSLSPESKRGPRTNGICGRQQQSALELSVPDSFCLKTCRESAPTCPWLSVTCADLGMKFQDPSSLGLTTLARRTDENGCGLLPTARACDGEKPPYGDDHHKGIQATINTPRTTPRSISYLLPTPRSGKTTDETEEAWTARQRDGKVSTPPLGLAIQMLPTASCRDHKGGANWENRKRDGQQRPEADKTLPDVF